MEHLINVGRRSLNNRVLFSMVKRQATTAGGEGVSSSSSSLSPSPSSLLSSSSSSTIAIVSRRTYAAKKSAQLTEAQIQFQKHTAELGFKEKTSIRGTLYEFHDVETSIKYMKSEAFRTAYGEKLIWQWYIRNHKGGMPRMATRLECVRDGRYIAGNPCPVCRDPYLVVNFRNLDLLHQFLSPDSGYLLPARITNVCRKTQENLTVAFEKACDHGLIDHPIPHRAYNYQHYMPQALVGSSRKVARTAAVEGVEGVDEDEDDKPSVLLGMILGANRKRINHIYDELKEEDIALPHHPHPHHHADDAQSNRKS